MLNLRAGQGDLARCVFARSQNRLIGCVTRSVAVVLTAVARRERGAATDEDDGEEQEVMEGSEEDESEMQTDGRCNG